jgi:LmbE family N-acetylglucosaminyl deacetylase
MNAGDALDAMRRLPVHDAATIVSGAPVLVLAPHPDDEVLGCGGLCLALAEAGIPVAVLFLTDGTGSHPGSHAYPPERLRDLREAEARAACAILGIAPDRVGFLRLRDTAAPMNGAPFDDAAERVARACRDWGCATICATWRADPHCDHLAADMIARRVAARLGVCHLAYPVWGWTLPRDTELGEMQVTGARLMLGDRIGAKRRALLAHASQLGAVIDDDPGGFQLDAATLERMMQPFEVFLDMPPNTQ